jgi:hypothetical protein
VSDQVQQRPAALELRSSEVQSEPEHTLFASAQWWQGSGGGVFFYVVVVVELTNPIGDVLCMQHML